MEEEILVKNAQNGDVESLNKLLSTYKMLVNKIARSYFLIGGDIEDIVQEGMIGLYKAITNFKIDKNASFKTFATTCIKNQIQNAVRVASSEKNKILSDALPILEENKNSDDEEDTEIILPSSLPLPDFTVLERENLNEIFSQIKDTLSKLEYKVLILYLKGYNYNEISNTMNISKKSIDNALTRIKSKLAFLKNKE
jgi:RNA polymerase sporulation-specific sigma factor